MLLGFFFSGNGMVWCWVMVHRGGRRSMAGGVCVLLACAHVYMRTHVIAYFSTTRPQFCVICCAITFYGGRKVFPSTTDRPQNVVICICHAKWFGNSNWFAEEIQLICWGNSIDLLRKFIEFAEEIHWIWFCMSHRNFYYPRSTLRKRIFLVAWRLEIFGGNLF